MARVFEDQVNALRTGLAETNLAIKLGLTDTQIAAANDAGLLVTAVQGLSVFGDQKYAVTTRIPGAIRMGLNLGAMTAANLGPNLVAADLRADWTNLDPNLPAGQATEYGQRNWDSN